MTKRNSAPELRRTIAALMGVHGETQEELATAIRLTQGQVSRKLAGQAVITLLDCDAIAVHYGIATAELLSGTTVAVTKSLEARDKGGRAASPADPSASPLG
jgi:transcriptional regulator with XRE-family HTH domain